MGEQGWKNYFQFSRKERIGIISLLLVVFGLLLFPPMYDRWVIQKTKIVSLEEQVILSQLQKKPAPFSTDESASSFTKNKYDDKETGDKVVPTRFFPFDPNTASPEEWKKLGVRDKTIQTIQRFISKGGRFRTPSDIHKVYGLSPSLAERLEPFVKIPESSITDKYRVDSFRKKDSYVVAKEKSPHRPRSVEINSADSLLWVDLPGIGPSLTHRILNFREKLGGFYDINQLAEVYALPDSTFQSIKPFLSCAVQKIRKIRINAVTAAELEQHPYFRKKLARVILSYRDQHGPFRSLDELNRVFSISPEQLTKLLPYLSVEE